MCSVLFVVERPSLHCTFYSQNCTRHGYEDIALHTINIQEQTILQNSPYIYPHIQSQSPRASPLPSPSACWQSLRGRFSRLTLLPRKLSTSKVHIYVLVPEVYSKGIFFKPFCYLYEVVRTIFFADYSFFAIFDRNFAEIVLPSGDANSNSQVCLKGPSSKKTVNTASKSAHKP